MNRKTEKEYALQEAIKLVEDPNFTFRKIDRKNKPAKVISGSIPNLSNPIDANKASLFLNSTYGSNLSNISLEEIACDVIKSYTGNEELGYLDRNAAYTCGYTLDILAKKLSDEFDIRSSDTVDLAEDIIRIYEYVNRSKALRSAPNKMPDCSTLNEAMAHLIEDVISLCDRQINLDTEKLASKKPVPKRLIDDLYETELEEEYSFNPQ